MATKIIYKNQNKIFKIKRKQIERDMQFALMRWALLHPICKNYLIHIANERRCSEREGARLKALGVKPGVSDLLLAYPNKTFHSLWLELKVNDNKLTESQKKWLSLMQLAGFATAVVYDDWEKAKIIIESYLDDRFEMFE
jgi:VRR-NUC domain